MAKVSDVGAHMKSGELLKFIPEPKSRVSTTFSDVMRSVGSVAGSAVGLASGIDPTYTDLLNKQVELQTQMQLVTMESNIEKTRHETKMTALRNYRAS